MDLTQKTLIIGAALAIILVLSTGIIPDVTAEERSQAACTTMGTGYANPDLSCRQTLLSGRPVSTRFDCQAAGFDGCTMEMRNETDLNRVWCKVGGWYEAQWLEDRIPYVYGVNCTVSGHLTTTPRDWLLWETKISVVSGSASVIQVYG